MLKKRASKNTIGGECWEIEIDTFFYLTIDQSGHSQFVVEFKEKQFFRHKLHFSFVSQEILEETIIAAFDKCFEFYATRKDYEWSQKQKEGKLEEILFLLNENKQFK